MPSSADCARASRSTARAAALLCAALLAACVRPAEPRQEQLYALGTLVTLRYYDADAEAAAAATTELEQLYRQLGRDWYPWHDADGELVRINAALARGEAVTVSPALANLLQRAGRLEERSGGLFNVALGALTRLWGFDDPLQDDWRPPADADVAAALAGDPGAHRLHWRGLELTSDSTALVLDPGGIAKGAILALSAEVLARHGIVDAIVDLGGDLTVLGTVDGRAARIGIRDPAGGPPLGHVTAAGGEAVVTSGNYERYFEFDGHRYAHVIDPRSGRPAGAAASVTVVDADPVLADAAATALLIAGPDAFEATCAALGVRRALLVTPGGDLRLTAAMRERVHWRQR